MLDFGSVLKNSKIIYESKDFDDFRPLDSFGDGSLKFFGQGDLNSEDGFDCKETLENQYAIGNNIDYMKFLLEKKHLGSKFNLIYIDPPFFSKASYYASFNLGEGQVKPMAYKDSWEGSREAYLTVLAAQLMLIRDLLSEEGSVFVHLDWHASHYVKILMDEIFGEENFVNEIIWQYKSGGASGKSFARKHDTILFYGKGPKRYFEPQKEKSYNRGLKPYRFKGVEEFEDEIGWYTMVNAKDVWNIDMVGRTSFERTGYATQKPEALLERILLSTTKEGDLVGDFFSGSGVLAAVSKRLNRRFNCCDQGEIAFGALMGRLDFRKPGSVLKVLVQDSCNVGCETGCETGCNVGFETATKEGKIFKNPKVAVSFKVAQGEGFVGDFRYVDYDLDEKAFDPKSLAALKATMAKTPWQLVCFLAVDFGASSQGDGFSYCFNFGSRGMDENFSFDLNGAGGAFDESSDLLEFEQLMDYEKRELGREVRIVIVDIFGNFFDISLKVR